jgi:O-methyltransferase
MELPPRIKNALNWTGKRLKDTMISAGLRDPEFLPDTSPAERDIIRAVRPYTMTSIRHLEFLLKAISYFHRNKITGDIAECGVWKGGCILAAARQVGLLGELSRSFWLYDTFGGMPSPSEDDGDLEKEFYQSRAVSDGLSDWCRCGEEDVRSNLRRECNLPEHRLHFVKGLVEETLQVSENLPDRIALLRLDTDWYSSTKAELDVLVPRVVPGGIVIIDDYGHWSGSRKATDEWLQSQPFKPLLLAVDRTCRAFIKQ